MSEDALLINCPSKKFMFYKNLYMNVTSNYGPGNEDSQFYQQGAQFSLRDQAPGKSKELILNHIIFTKDLHPIHINK